MSASPGLALAPDALARALSAFDQAMNPPRPDELARLAKRISLPQLPAAQRLAFLERAAKLRSVEALALICPQPDPALFNSSPHCLLSCAITRILNDAAILFFAGSGVAERDAFSLRSLPFFRALLELGANPNGPKRVERSPLALSMRAAPALHIPLIELLLSRGARPRPDDMRLAIDLKLAGSTLSALLAARNPRSKEIDQLADRARGIPSEASAAIAVFSDSKSLNGLLRRKPPARAKAKARL